MPLNNKKDNTEEVLQAILVTLQQQIVLLQDIQQRLAYQSSRADEVE